MPNDLTFARLRELIAAARCNASYCAYCGQPDGHAAQALADYLDGNASALADALKAKELLGTLMGHVLSVRRDNTDEWMEGLVETLNATEMAIGGKDRCEYRRRDGVIRVLRAAKEASDGK